MNTQKKNVQTHKYGGNQLRKQIISNGRMDSKNLKNLSPSELNIFFNSFDTIITDCDGVLWYGMRAIKNAPETINYFKMSKPVYFLTNSSTKTTDQLSKKFTSLGFKVSENEILGTAMLTAEYLKGLKFNKTVYLVAPPSVKSELDAAGITNIGCGPDIMTDGSDFPAPLNPDVGAVVVGFDTHFSYPKLYKATAYLTKSDHVEFLATNPDDKLPRNGGGYEPGSGSLVKAIESASGRKASIIGKPSRFAFDFVRNKLKIDPKRVLMIGDRCDTDIEFGRNLGMQTLLVLTGNSNLREIRSYQSSNNSKSKIPHYYTNTIGDLLDLVPNRRLS